MLCILCHFIDDITKDAVHCVDGSYLCADHADDVINRAHDIWWTACNAFSATATIREARARANKTS